MNVATPIYKLFTFRTTEHWYQLSPRERADLDAKINAALEEAGGTRLIVCDALWASEEWPVFGVERFPSLEALQKFQRLLDQMGLFRCIESRMLIGTQAQEA
jgi:hypothetical protein